MNMAGCVNNAKINILIITLLYLHFWGCSFFQTATYPDPILIEDNDYLSIRYEFAEKRIIGTVKTGDFQPEAYIFAVFHRGDLGAPIIQKMFFPQDTLELLVSENHLNAAPEGNLAVLKVIGGDFQQEEVAFSYSKEDKIVLPPFQLHKVPYYYEKQTVKRVEGFLDSARIDSGEILFARLIEGQQVAKYPKRGEERNITASIDSIYINPTPSASKVNVFIYSTPNDADVIIDGKILGKTPIENLDLAVGLHSFKLTKKNYVPIEKKLDIQPSKKVKMEFRLNRLNIIHFSSKEEGLKYVLDEEYEWWNKRIKLQLESGKHTLKVYKGGEMIKKQVLDIDWNDRVEFSLLDTFAANKDST